MRAAHGIAALAAVPVRDVTFDGLTFREVASVTKVAGGIAMNVIPDECTAHVNFRYAPGLTPDEAAERLVELTAGHGSLSIEGKFRRARSRSTTRWRRSSSRRGA